jgi:hypothetical protein
MRFNGAISNKVRRSNSQMRFGRGACARVVLFLALVIAMPLAPRLRAQSQSAIQREYEIKAAYLYNFINYIAWPADALPAGGTITIGIVGENPFGAALNPLNGKQVKGRTLVVKQIAESKNMGQCQIVFFSSSEKQHVPELLAKLRDSRTLTVSEIEGFAQGGGIINFISERNKVRFEINPAAARQRGLTISSDLLKLANVVKS